MEKVRKVISTKSCTNYALISDEHRRIWGIEVENAEKSVFYAFDPEEAGPKVSNEILEKALKAFLKSNAEAFDLFTVYFSVVQNREEYIAIAEKVFKEHWNELYNLDIADIIFERKITLDSLNENGKFPQFDFWEENK